MPAIQLRLGALSAALAVLAATSGTALAQKKYDIGATDTEIKIGNIMPYSGAASAYGVIGKTEQAYFNKINAEGGINGRKINFVSYDDGYSPPKAVEQARKLVESDEVLVVFNPLGTPSNSAIQSEIVRVIKYRHFEVDLWDAQNRKRKILLRRKTALVSRDPLWRPLREVHLPSGGGSVVHRSIRMKSFDCRV